MSDTDIRKENDEHRYVIGNRYETSQPDKLFITIQTIDMKTFQKLKEEDVGYVDIHPIQETKEK